ncbi:MAG: hypothetical protein KDI01_06805 [Halioglobus sp.]|nr:hypothetical protein [Halioglobus sp.]
MNRTRWRSALLAAALMVCPALLAQPQAGVADPPGESQENTAVSGGAASSATPASGPGGDSAGPLPRREESPFDYRASEQISEDLSVSFPVDI